MAKETNQDNAQDNTQTENGNNTNAGRIGTSITPEGEMTANVLLEALGTTIEPDLLVEALTTARSHTSMRGPRTTNASNSSVMRCSNWSPRKRCTRCIPT